MEVPKLQVTLYVASKDAEALLLIDKLRDVLAKNFEGEWKMDVVEVMSTPEKAIANNIFATPTLMRDIPAPVVKVLGEIANEKRILGVLTKMHHDTSVVII